MNCISSKSTVPGASRTRLPATGALGGKQSGLRVNGPAYFLNSFHPLCESEHGRALLMNNGVPSFVDFSIRREPDFQNPFPSITGLCRCDELVGPASEGDLIAYVTVRSAGPRRLVAILRVLHKMPNHGAAADWYQRQGLPLPSNCVVEGNKPRPASEAGQALDAASYELWEDRYQQRARNYPAFLICQPVIGPELINPPFVPENIFGRAFPNTRSPQRLTKLQFGKLRALFESSHQLVASK